MSIYNYLVQKPTDSALDIEEEIERVLPQVALS